MLPAGALVSVQDLGPWVCIFKTVHSCCPKPAGPGIPQRLSKDANQPWCNWLAGSAECVPMHLNNWGRKLLEKKRHLY